MNSKRFGEIDFARSIPILFLPIVHIYEETLWWNSLNEDAVASGNILLYLCAFGPSIFMMILGMNIAFTTHNSPKELATRGVKTLIISIALNIARYFLPALVLFLQGEDWAIAEGITSCCMSDILPFAGMAFLFFALMRKWKISPLNIILIALVLLTIHTLIMPEDMDGAWYQELLGNFIHCTEDSAFPVLAWLIYPAIGYSVGLRMQSFESENQLREFYKKILIVSAICLISLCVATYAQGMDVLLIAAAPANDNMTELFNVMLDVLLGGVFISALSFVYFELQKVASKKIMAFITDLSKAIMIFYIIQWILIYWVGGLFTYKYIGSHILGNSFILLFSFAITLISAVGSISFKKALDHRKATISYIVTT